jgi:choline dehydrogenase-like flavoprotein
MKSFLLVFALSSFLGAAAVVESDLCVYGGTSGGVAAAVQAARLGKTVVIAEPGQHLATAAYMVVDAKISVQQVCYTNLKARQEQAGQVVEWKLPGAKKNTVISPPMPRNRESLVKVGSERGK